MIRAIDIHTHTSDQAHKEFLGEYGKFYEKYFGRPQRLISVDEQADMYRELGMMFVLLALDAETNTGNPRITNEQVAEAAKRHGDVLIPFGSVDPWKGKYAVQEAERCVTELGMKGMKFQQILQGFFPNDQRFYPLWEKCQELQVPLLFHMGTTGIGAGAPGGMGIKLKYAQPIPYLDDVAADFPELRIIGAHPAWPWQEEMLAVCRHKANVYIDLSGWSPKYFSPSLIQYANTLLQDKVLFGSDFPAISPERWLQDFEQAPFRDEVRPKILLENAKRLLKLEL